MTHLVEHSPLFGMFFMLFFAVGLFLAFMLLVGIFSKRFSTRNNEKLKLSAYECGVISLKQKRGISAQYYPFIILFILFDIEILFMFPWAVLFKQLGLFGFVEMILFIFILLIGYFYALRKGALKWHNIR